MTHEILQDYYLNGAIVYINDTVIYGSTVEGFPTVLDQILSRMTAFNDRVKLSSFMPSIWAKYRLLAHIQAN